MRQEIIAGTSFSQGATGLNSIAMNRIGGEDQGAIEDRYIATDPAFDQNLAGNVE